MATTELETNGKTETYSTSSTGKKEKTAKRQKAMKSIGVGASASEMATATYTARVEPSPIDWSQLRNFECFSTSADGSFPKIKTSKSAYADIKSQSQETGIGGGRVFRIHL